MCVAALFILAKLGKQPKGSKADEWTGKRWCVYTVEYYLGIKKVNSCYF